MSNIVLKGKYVHIPQCGWVFHKDKIVKVVLRPSLFYLRYQYIMKITYGKHWNESVMFGGNNAMVPVNIHHDTKEYKVKIRNDESLNQWVEDWSSLEIKIENKT